MSLSTEKLFLGKEKSSLKLLPNLIQAFFSSVSLSMLWGNLYYVYMARKLAYKENRGDVCTMPYGINTPGACKIRTFKSNKTEHFCFGL